MSIAQTAEEPKEEEIFRLRDIVNMKVILAMLAVGLLIHVSFTAIIYHVVVTTTTVVNGGVNATCNAEQLCDEGFCLFGLCRFTTNSTILDHGTGHPRSDDYSDFDERTTATTPIAIDDITGLANEVTKREPKQCHTSADCSPFLCIGGICIGRGTEESTVDATGVGNEVEQRQADPYAQQRCANGLGRCIANVMPRAEEITGVEIHITQDDNDFPDAPKCHINRDCKEARTHCFHGRCIPTCMGVVARDAGCAGEGFAKVVKRQEGFPSNMTCGSRCYLNDDCHNCGNNFCYRQKCFPDFPVIGVPEKREDKALIPPGVEVTGCPCSSHGDCSACGGSCLMSYGVCFRPQASVEEADIQYSDIFPRGSKVTGCRCGSHGDCNGCGGRCLMSFDVCFRLGGGVDNVKDD